MNKKQIKLLLSVLLIAVAVMTSCSKKMDPLSQSLFNAEPSPLELVATKVSATINGRFPADWFDKNATVTVTPVLKYGATEAVGQSQTFQGENVAGNGTVVNKKQGTPITMRASFDYTPEMSKSELFVRFAVKIKGKDLTGFPDIKVADGVIATAALANAYTTTPAVAKDAFQRIIKEAHDADILFLVNRAELRASELNATNITAWKDLIKEVDANDRKKLDVEVAAYASPEGGFDYNEKLSKRREESTTTYLEKEFKKEGIDTELKAKYTAQDWDGFQKLVAASSLQDKNLVLSVLSMYKDPAVREREIKNISAVYSELAETILPQLRRSRLIANVEIIGKTDEELVAASKGDARDLSIEEILYAATLSGVDAEKMYKQATQRFPNDARGWNNLGAVQLKKGEYDTAKTSFGKAKQMANGAEANMNMALMEMAQGKTAVAEQLLGNAAGASNIDEALGLMYIQKGEYNKAINAFGDAKTNNAALAQILAKDYNKAKRTLDGITSKDGTSHYLAAIIAARTNNTAGVVSNLKQATTNGISTTQIATDMEFAKFLSNPDIQNVMRAY